MPERITSAVTQAQDWMLFLMIGIVIGIGQSFRERETDISVIVGRAICVGGMAMASGAVLIWAPDLPRLGQIGVASLLASLGTSGLEKILARFLQGKDSA